MLNSILNILEDGYPNYTCRYPTDWTRFKQTLFLFWVWIEFRQLSVKKKILFSVLFIAWGLGFTWQCMNTTRVTAVNRLNPSSQQCVTQTQCFSLKLCSAVQLKQVFSSRDKIPRSTTISVLLGVYFYSSFHASSHYFQSKLTSRML